LILKEPPSKASLNKSGAKHEASDIIGEVRRT
jgi:hypothetical protein